MAYGLSTSASIDGGSVEQAATRPRSPVRSWHRLSEASRLKLIERALTAANDRIDGYPLAL
jgi:hypothetical protein